MRRRIGTTGSMLWLATALLMTTAMATTAPAEDYRSGFGFGISVPDVWLVLTQGEVAGRPDLFRGEVDKDETAVLQAIPLEMRQSVFKRIVNGDLEIFYRREGLTGSFVDNINIMRQLSPLPDDGAQLDAVCQILPGEFSRVFGRPITMDACEIRDMMGSRALYLQFDGAIQGTKTMQYQLEQKSDLTLVLTATSAAPNLPRMLSEFESMVASIRHD